MKRLLPTTFLTLGILVGCAPAFAEGYPVVVGDAVVADGDTIKMATATVTADGRTVQARKVKVRLLAIDTPEKKQVCLDANDKPYACGQVSLRAMADMLKTGPVTCLVHDIDQYKRWVSVCSTPQFPDINAEMVRRGFAVAAPQYGKAYVDEEAVAKDAKAGLWAGQFMMPDEWRKAQKSKKKS